MSFARSNSLSINTGAANLFSQNNQNASSNHPAPAGGLFGSAQQQSSHPSQAGSLFGSTLGASQPAQATGLFGSTAQTSQPQQSGGLFGNTAQTSQPQQSGGLFGSTTNTQQQGAATGGGGGLFGGGGTQQPTSGTGLFGNVTTNNTAAQGTGLFGASAAQTQPQQQSSLFGSNTDQARPSLFGGGPMTNTAQPGAALFGGTQNNAGGNGLFGGSATTNHNQQQPSLFAPQQSQQQPPNNSIFGLSAQQPFYKPPTSLLGASQYRAAQSGIFAGKLTMGQANAAPAQQPQGAVKVHYNDMRPTTRFADCTDEVKNDLERMDQMIQAQERFCRQIEAILPKHAEGVQSLAPDVELVKEKAEAVEHVLAADAQGVDAQKGVLATDEADFERCRKIQTNLAQPQPYHHVPQLQRTSGESTLDGFAATDLIGAYFLPLASQLGSTLDVYSSNLCDIENHMRVIEASTVHQAQQLAAKRAGMGAGGASGSQGGEDIVRDLADTLRGFEASILDAAARVGACREGVNGLALGRIAGGLGGGTEGRRGW